MLQAHLAALLLLAAAPAQPAPPAAKGAGTRGPTRPPPDDGLGRTPPQSWVKTGYQQLRWGMGPGDVKDALAAGGGPLKTEEPFQTGEGFDLGGEGGARVAVPGLVVAGLPSVLGFRFFRGRLTAVVLLPAEDPGDPAAWAVTVTALLTERYGPPSSRGGEQTIWNREGLKVTIPFLPGWTSSIGWFAPLVGRGEAAAPVVPPAPASPSPAEAAQQKARKEAARKATEAAAKAKAEAEARAKAALKAEAQKL